MGSFFLLCLRGNVDLASQELLEPAGHLVSMVHKAPRVILAFQGTLVFLGVQVLMEHQGLKVQNWFPGDNSYAILCLHKVLLTALC